LTQTSHVTRTHFQGQRSICREQRRHIVAAYHTACYYYYWLTSIAVCTVYISKGALHELNQMVNLMVNYLVKRRRIARDANPWLKLT